MNDSKNNPIVWQEAEHGMYINFPYNEKFMDEMRLIVPSEERKWKGDRWWISDLYLDEVDALLFDYFGKRGEGRT